MAGIGILLLGAGLGIGGLWLWKKHEKHEKKEHFKHMHKMHGGKNFVHHPMGRMHMNMGHVKGMLHQDILNRAKHPLEVHRNHHRLMMMMDQHDVMLSPLLHARVSGKMTEKQFHNHLRSIEDRICDELQLPMKNERHHVMRDMINHDGSTTDMDNGHDGDNTPSIDHWMYEDNDALSETRCRPHIHDLSARMHLAAATTLGDDDDIHHFNLYRSNFAGLARSNNVELADDYNFQHFNVQLPVQNVFSEDGDEPL